MRQSILPDPTALQLVAIEADCEGVTIVVRTKNPTAPCPDCGGVTARTHSVGCATRHRDAWVEVEARRVPRKVREQLGGAG